jgi:hypothetical protein
LTRSRRRSYGRCDYHSERKNPDGTCARVGDEALRAALAAAVHLPDWRGQVTPHLLRHFCTSQQL